MPIERAPTAQEIDRDLADLSDSALERLAAVEVRQQTSWEGLTDQERESLRASNMLSKRAFQARRKEEEAAKVATKEAAAQAAYRAELERYRQTVRTAFPGTDAEFSELWPNLKNEWLIEQTRAGLRKTTEEAARKLINLSF